MRPLLALLSVTVLAACAGPNASEAVPAPGPTADATAEPTPVGIPLDAGCTSDLGVTVAYPADWAVNAGDVVPACTRFAPEPFEVRPQSDVRLGAVVFTVREVPLAEAAAPPPDEVSRTDVLVDGRPAVRQVLVTGPGLYAIGTRITRYLVDLGERGTLVADTVRPPHPAAVGEVAVLDAMMTRLDTGGHGSR